MSNPVVKADDMFAMSDDDFAAMNPPESSPIVQEEPKAAEPAPEPVVEEPTPAATPPVVEEPKEPEAPEVIEQKEEAKPEDNKQLFDKDGKPLEAEPTPEAKAPEVVVPPTGSETNTPAPITAESAMAFYAQVMAPIKANGKEITLKSPEEAMQLIQMGANYTRKMQAIAPHRKMLTMLQNNDLMDEGKLDYLIALDKRDPEAIKKLIKDAGIDPLEIDTSVESTFRTGNHQVTDQEVALSTVMEDIQSTPHGVATLQEVNTNWDQASKDAIWDDPEILSLINTQRENGVYDAITTEMNRLKTLGTIPTTTPFLKAYNEVGKQLYAKQQPSPAPVGSTTPTPEAQPAQVVTPPAAPVALGTTVATPKPQAVNGDKAGAASPTRTAPTKAKAFINPLEMSDDAFMKQFEGRL